MDEWLKVALQIIASVTASLLAVTMTKRFFGPRLKIVAHKPEFGLFETREVKYPASRIVHRPMGPDAVPIVQERAPAVYGDVAYVRIGIKNGGRGIALKCRGYLTNVEAIHDNAAPQFFDAIPLVWSYLPVDSTLDIPPGVTVHLDVASAAKDENVLVPRLAVIPTRYETL
jgi:hypothetical protein